MTLDPYWNQVPLLVPCATDPFVESRHAYTVTQGTVDVELSTSVKPGAAWVGSADFVTNTTTRSGATGNDGTQLRLASTDDFTLGSGDFTIECWASTSNAAMPQDDYGDSTHFTPHALIERSNGTAQGSWAIQFLTYRVENPPGPDKPYYYISFYCGDYAPSTAMMRVDTGSGTDNAVPIGWHHYAVTRNGNEWTLWMDGVPLERVIATTTILSPSGAGADIRIGNSILETDSGGNAQNGVGSYGRAHHGYIADVRVTKGYCRYGRSFEPCFVDMDAAPGAPLPTSEDTGDYSSESYRGATGATGAAASGEPLEGEPGEGRVSLNIALPSPTPQYDQQNESETRRTIMDALRRGA